MCGVASSSDRCIWLCKDTNLKANHNTLHRIKIKHFGVYDSAKILIWKQITTNSRGCRSSGRCIWLCKDTNLKANHNKSFITIYLNDGVYDSAKILIWKQITTQTSAIKLMKWCIWLCKDTNLKANHNSKISLLKCREGVYDSAKILIWKQITTYFILFGATFQVYMTLQRY